MKCVCRNKMNFQMYDYVYDMYYCENCGRLFFRDMSKGENNSYWITPKLVMELENES